MYKANIWRLYIYRVFGSLNFITPIFVIYLGDKGLGMTQIMILQAVFTLALMLFSIPCGALADRFGRKNVMIVSTILYSAGYFVYYLSNSFTELMIAELIFSLSVASWEGSKSAFLYDTLKALGEEKRYKSYLGNLFAINGVMNAISSIFGSLIVLWTGSLGAPFIASGIAVAVGLMALFGLKEPKSKRKKSYHKDLMAAIRFTLEHKRIRSTILYTSMVGAGMFTMWILFQPYFELAGVPIVMFGALYFMMSLLQAVFAKAAHRLERLFGLKLSIFLVGIVPLACVSVMALTRSWIGLLMPLLMIATEGFSDPVISDYMHRMLRSHHRATVLSLSLAAWSLASAVTAPIFGFVSDSLGIQAAFIGVVILLAVSLLVYLKSIN